MKWVFGIAIVLAIVLATATAITVFNYPPSSPAVAQQQLPEPKTNPAQLIHTPEEGEPIVVEILPNSTSRFILEPYSPGILNIEKGDTVTWVNNDAAEHTVTSVAFNSGVIYPKDSEEGSSTFNFTFDRPGVYAYFCQIYPFMSGTVYVNADETQRELISTIDINTNNIIIEMPYDTAYNNKFEQGFFIPSNAYIPSNSRVTWVNNDYVAHTATAADDSFNTQVIEPRESKTLTIEGNSRRIAYYCQIHPWMQASLTILQ